MHPGRVQMRDQVGDERRVLVDQMVLAEQHHVVFGERGEDVVGGGAAVLREPTALAVPVPEMGRFLARQQQRRGHCEEEAQAHARIVEFCRAGAMRRTA